MLQVRDVTNIEAQWLIYAVRYDEHHCHIETLFGAVDQGDSMGRRDTFSRQTVIRAIEQGSKFCTVYQAEPGRYVRGAMLRVIEVGGKKYVTTVADRTARDNLGNLPEQ